MFLYKAFKADLQSKFEICIINYWKLYFSKAVVGEGVGGFKTNSGHKKNTNKNLKLCITVEHCIIYKRYYNQNSSVTRKSHRGLSKK